MVGAIPAAAPGELGRAVKVCTGQLGPAVLVCPPVPLPARLYDLEVADVVSRLQGAPQREMPVTHRFQPGAYLREIFMPADTFVVGHVHRYEHFNIVLSGRAKVMMEGQLREVNAGDVFSSGPGVQKLLYILADMRWITVHANPSESRDVAALEEDIVVLSPDLVSAKGTMTLDEFRLSLVNSLTG